MMYMHVYINIIYIDTYIYVIYSKQKYAMKNHVFHNEIHLPLVNVALLCVFLRKVGPLIFSKS